MVRYYVPANSDDHDVNAFDDAITLMEAHAIRSDRARLTRAVHHLRSNSHMLREVAEIAGAELTAGKQYDLH